MKRTLHTTGTPEANEYLFMSPAGSVEFVIIDEDMAQLNDFCVSFIEAAQAKVEELDHQSRNGQGGIFADQHGHEIELSDDDIQDGAAVELDTWQDTGDFLAHANCLLLLACFAEKSLVALCMALGDKVPRPKGGQGKVAACLEFLKVTCELDFEDTEESIHVRELCRKIRNAFAHGEWGKCRELVGLICLPDAFAAVTSLLDAIEAATQSKP